ncbi:MAG: TIGR03617 family F420-dependent LLM class oxidoreductase, partial [Halioglobus sp.]|nr:TIGR03617 family F420-dependent LLM class oxidoreductase [Halioglobus sp.]
MFDPVRVGAMAAQLEEAGFDGAYTFEGQSDPFIAVAAAAMHTQKMELMTSIAVAFARNPMSLAYLGNDLQNLSGGRFILGLGAQVKAHIERRFSMPWGKPAARMREMVLAIRTIWDSWQTGERLKFEGEFYQHTLMSPVFSPPPNEHGMPLIFIAGVGPVMTEVAAEVGDGYFAHPFNTHKSMDELSLAAIGRGLEKAGKSRDDYTIAAQVMTATGLDDE